MVAVELLLTGIGMALDDPLVSRDAAFSEDHKVMSPHKPNKQSLRKNTGGASGGGDGGGGGGGGAMDDDEGPFGGGGGGGGNRKELDWYEQELECLARTGVPPPLREDSVRAKPIWEPANQVRHPTIQPPPMHQSTHPLVHPSIHQLITHPLTHAPVDARR